MKKVSNINCDRLIDQYDIRPFSGTNDNTPSKHQAAVGEFSPLSKERHYG